METNYYKIEPKKVLELLGSSHHGLSDHEALKRLNDIGFNELKQEKGTNIVALFISQFKDFLQLLLIVATAISLFLKEYIDAAAIFAIVLLSAILGFTQEYKAEKAMEALQKMAAPTATNKNSST